MITNSVFHFQKHIVYLKNIILKSKKPQKLLILLLGVIIFFIGLHVYTFSLNAVTGDYLLLRLDTDRGYAEFFQYFQFLCISILLVYIYTIEKKWMYLIWSTFFVFLLLDDSFSIHEDLGLYFQDSFSVSEAFGLRGQDFGELAASGIMAAVFVLPIGYAQFFTSSRTRFINMNYILLFSVLIFFGVGIDMVHSMLEEYRAAGLLTILEDAGEMLAVSLILWYSYYLALTVKNKNREMNLA